MLNFINKSYTYAVVGSTNNKSKYGYKVLKHLTGQGYKVVPINPHEENIQGLKVYKSITAYPGRIDVVIFVVPPSITLEVLKQVKESGIKKVWLQPGSENQECINFCTQNNIDYMTACIMLRH